MKSLIMQLLNRRVVRYGLVGGIGILINELALSIFSFFLSQFHLIVNFSLLGHQMSVDLEYALASACAFEISTTINFVLNQLFTYHEQKLQGWDWVRRAGKAQMTSLSALSLSFIIGLVLVYGFHIDQYIANPIGIIVVFIYSFSIARKFVFRPIPGSLSTSVETAEI